MVRAFDWRDGERLIRFGRGVAADPVAALGGPGYLLLTTPRAAGALPARREAAAAVHHVGPAACPSWPRRRWARAPARRRPHRGARRRPRDRRREGVAAARGGGARALAIPTTLSGAELTRVHRHAAGVAEDTPRVRCAVVICDPELAASQPGEELAASALNALGHAVEAPCTVAANPVVTLAAHEAARLLVGAFARAEPDRDALALGALLAGYALGVTGYGLHHVLAQTLVAQRPGRARPGERGAAAAHDRGARTALRRAARGARRGAGGGPAPAARRGCAS